MSTGGWRATEVTGWAQSRCSDVRACGQAYADVVCIQNELDRLIGFDVGNGSQNGAEGVSYGLVLGYYRHYMCVAARDRNRINTTNQAKLSHSSVRCWRHTMCTIPYDVGKRSLGTPMQMALFSADRPARYNAGPPSSHALTPSPSSPLVLPCARERTPRRSRPPSPSRVLR